ncbi:long-chain-fatty-acid--CoA ligase [Filobacillus milosensis]|uniref:Long-chain-fatty-acid--CoA ligase n=1 Tax=Filobacillus milosensis TaxID=94137 RepID=A0A4Y8IX32_9BACI|nr:long-chain-fatty-acid--CoA ligase [Filobacillus milosensis]TFB24975.1 long-chain-fatty-acid--CoA ligase [Filobacillus milosensis]
MGVELSKPWFKHYPEEVPKTIEYDNRPLHDVLEDTATNYPDKVAIHFLGKELTYQEVYDSAKKFASYLQDLGLEKGDRVAIMLPNTPQSVIAYYGALLGGGIVVQTNPLYTERELEYQLKDSGAKFLVCLDILLPRATNVKDQTDVKDIIVTGIKDYLPFPKNLIYPFIQKREYNIVVKPEHGGGTHLWTKMLDEASGQYEKHDIDPLEDLALLQYTGGTTGYPKGVMLTHRNLVANTQMSSKWIFRAEYGKETVLGILPFFHVYGMTAVMNLSVMMAQKMILVPKFDVDTVLKLIDKQKPTLFPGAPTIYIGLLNHPKISNYDLSSIEACLSGSAPLPVEVQQQFEKVTGGKLVEGYGLTESSPVTHSNLIYENRRAGTIGLPWPDTDSKVFKPETLEEMPVGEVGEIAVKGPQIMKGYWNRPEETANTIKDGWLLTGDMGYMDEDGYFYVVDRKKDMIIAGGFNIYPREVEEVLYEHEAISEAVVAGIPDPYRGETVKAYIVLKDGKSLTEEELDQYCRENLAAFKVPKLYEFRKELPKTAVGKILRRKLVDEEKEKMKSEEANQS